MNVLITDLHEDRPALRQQLPRHRQPIAQVSQIRVDAVLPSVTEGFDLFGLARDVLLLTILDVARQRRHLPVGIELDPVGRVEIDALDLAAKPLSLGEARHHGERVA